MAGKEFDVLLFGDLCAFDLIFGEYLARKGANVRIARRPRNDGEVMTGVPPGFLRAVTPQHLVAVRGPIDLIHLARRARAVITFTGAFGFALRGLWSLRRLLGLPPVVNHTTGSDFAEMLVAPGWMGAYYRHFTRTASLNMVVPYPHVLENVVNVGLRNICFRRYPYLLPEHPAPAGNPDTGRRIRYLHPSHLDFGINDPDPGRKSTKGNDRFIRAFIAALDQGLDAECLILYRGPDREEARRMTEESPHADRFIWSDGLPRERLFEEMAAADVIVDQFDVGGLGGIAVEAMGLGKPVMIYLDERSLDILYSERPPVLNARTEKEILDVLLAARDPAELATLGERARRWAFANHSGETCLDLLAYQLAVLTAGAIRI